jgi:hypothetical protein
MAKRPFLIRADPRQSATTLSFTVNSVVKSKAFGVRRFLTGAFRVFP